MKSLLQLWSALHSELSGWCGIDTDRDTKYVTIRSKSEGMSFWGITLPTYSEGLERGLSQGYVDDATFSTSFGRDNRGLPKFLGGFLRLVFDQHGVLLETPSVDAIQAIRQLTLVYGKMELPCSDARNAKAYAGYLECENRIQVWNRNVDADLLAEFQIACSSLFQSALNEVEANFDSLVPRHSNGSTADGLMGNQKWSSRYWTQRLEKAAPSLEWLYPSARYWADAQGVDLIEPGAEIPVKVIMVPKTPKSPRIIAEEPANVMYVQQSILRRLVPVLERHQSFIGFTDQVPNRELARLGSRDGELATLDLKEASDSVSDLLAQAVFANTPRLAELVSAARTRTADVRGSHVRLAKFASMGSALTFPVEAMVFATIVFMGIADAHNTSVPRLPIKRWEGKVRVYGDDIIVPVRYVPFVLRRLEDFNFQINVRKSFWNGNFRESCGGDYYNGEWVTPVRLRSMPPESRTEVHDVVSLVSFRNQLYQSGLWRTCAILDKELHSLLRFYPQVQETSSILGRHSLVPLTGGKMHKDYQSPMVKGYRLVSKLPLNEVDSLPALMKWFTTNAELPLSCDHLVRSGRPKRAALQFGYGSPF